MKRREEVGKEKGEGIRIVDEKQKTKNVKRSKRKKEKKRGDVDQVIGNRLCI